MGMILFPLIWLGCGLASASVASSKGHNGCLWFVLGFLFGPIALLISLVLSKESAPVRTHPSFLEKKCPFCAEFVKKEAIVCKHCGRDLPPAAQPALAPNAELVNWNDVKKRR